MSDLSDFKRIVYEPETRALRKALRDERKRSAELADALRQIAVTPSWGSGSGDRMAAVARAALDRHTRDDDPNNPALGI